MKSFMCQLPAKFKCDLFCAHRSSGLDDGDCSLRILNANLEYDDGVWQCQVTPSAFNTRDALISEGAELVVRGEKRAQISKPR